MVYAWFMVKNQEPYANGKTYWPTCIHLSGCMVAAERMVGAESLCEKHALVAETQIARSKAWAAKFANSPEGLAEARAERELESRVS